MAGHWGAGQCVQDGWAHREIAWVEMLAVLICAGHVVAGVGNVFAALVFCGSTLLILPNGRLSA
jgi:hypothetical protein